MTGAIVDKYRVLLVDNSNHFRNLFRLFASYGNILAATATTGKEAIPILGKFRMDCVIIDTHLPDLTIKEIMHAMRHVESLRINRRTPAIAISNDNLPLHELRSLYQLGVKDFISKNKFLKDLENAVNRICQPYSRQMCRQEPELPAFIYTYSGLNHAYIE